MTPSPATFALRPVVDGAASATAGQAASAGVAIKTEVPEDLFVLADERMVETILRNLLSNAVKFSDEGDEVLVKATRLGDRVKIETIDEGLGMLPEDAARLFDADRREAIAAPKERKGSGLGLTLCREFTRANGGAIRAESAPGEGSVFTVELPVADPKAD
jgi:signal transduction histidine kinase